MHACPYVFDKVLIKRSNSLDDVNLDQFNDYGGYVWNKKRSLDDLDLNAVNDYDGYMYDKKKKRSTPKPKDVPSIEQILNPESDGFTYYFKKRGFLSDDDDTDARNHWRSNAREWNQAY